VLDWDDTSNDDVDLWIMGSTMQQPLSFQVKNADYWHLDRDDLGMSTDITYIAGEMVKLQYNREVGTMRGLMPGDYNINVHMYRKNSRKDTTISVTLIDVNTYKEIYKMKRVMTEQNQIEIFPSFTVDKEGEIIATFRSDVIFATKVSATGDPVIPQTIPNTGSSVIP